MIIDGWVLEFDRLYHLCFGEDQWTYHPEPLLRDLPLALLQSELKTSKNKSKKAAEADAKAEEEAATKAGGCSNKTVKFDNLINPKTLKAFDKKNVRLRFFFVFLSRVLLLLSLSCSWAVVLGVPGHRYGHAGSHELVIYRVAGALSRRECPPAMHKMPRGSPASWT